MRTKTLLLTAVLAVASAATSMADVFSVNVVGYVNTVIPSGFSIINNPLNATNNSLSHIIPAPPQGTQIYKFTGGPSGTYQIATFDLNDDNVLVWDNDLTLVPGEGAWIRKPGAGDITNTFVGEVVQGPTTNSIPNAFSLKGSIVPQSGQLNTVLGFPAAQGDTIYFYRNNNYVICTYDLDDDNNLNWDTVPVPNVGEGFWVRTTSAKEWTRTFTVN